MTNFVIKNSNPQTHVSLATVTSLVNHRQINKQTNANEYLDEGVGLYN